ncbi:TPA: restriction endonuclease subunit S [Vibrio parahaemolyticus]|nr:restriction endonuclease subunit S [Vibrio parahaemolyticus]HCG6550625.1 restriction endonuclease subunit S [Vibrio parahaemolyticus]
MNNLKEKLPFPYQSIPEEWHAHYISDLAVIATGDSDTQDKVEDGEYPFYVRSQTIERANKFTFDGEAILTAGDGVGVGKVFHLVNGKFAMHQRVYRISNFKNRISPEYLYSYFSKNFIRQVCKFTAKTSVDSVRMDMIAKMVVPVPPLAEQRKIAQILSTWDRGIATTEKLIDASKQQKKALMQQLLTGKKRLGCAEGTYTFKKTRYGSIPTDWTYPAIKDIAVQKSEKNNEGLDLPVLSCSKYDGFVDSLKYFKKKVYSDDTSGYRIISKGCFGFPANHIEEGSIGLQNLYEKGIVSPIYVVFQAKKDLVENRYLYALLKTDHYRQIFSAATNASVDRRGSLRWKEFSAIHVSLPPLEEQKAIADVLELADKETKLLEAKLAHLKQEKKALMQQLLTGKRRVKVAETEVA